MDIGVPLSYSIIIPCYNAEKTIRPCLESVYALDKTADFEVILVDDGSIDQTLVIAREFPCTVIKTDCNAGAASARNRGVEKSRGDILLFIDSDVILPRHTLTMIQDAIDNKKVDGVVGIFAAYNPFVDFFSQYKSLYCHYKYLVLEGGAAINTAITALKRKAFAAVNGFDEKMEASEDNELADRLFKAGFKVVIDHRLEVVHLKEFNALSLLRNDYRKSITLARIFFRTLKAKRIVVQKEFTDISINSMLNVPIVYGATVLWIATAITGSRVICWAGVIATLVFIFNNLEFWKFLKKNKGWVFTLLSMAFTWVDYIAVGLGIVRGYFKR